MKEDNTRTCTKTGETMTEGFCFMDGDAYFKYEKDALEYAKSLGYKDLDESYKDEAHYWTQWED